MGGGDVMRYFLLFLLTIAFSSDCVLNDMSVFKLGNKSIYLFDESHACNEDEKKIDAQQLENMKQFLDFLNSKQERVIFLLEHLPFYKRCMAAPCIMSQTYKYFNTPKYVDFKNIEIRDIAGKVIFLLTVDTNKLLKNNWLPDILKVVTFQDLFEEYFGLLLYLSNLKINDNLLSRYLRQIFLNLNIILMNFLLNLLILK